jgi:antitoxin CptB
MNVIPNSHTADKKRLLWQCRRGMLELEILLREFVEQDYDHLRPDNQQAFEDLLQIIDPVLFDYLMGVQEAENESTRTIVRLVRDAARHRVKA